MTSGQFHMFPVHDISVDRENRQRRDLSDIGVLADSIRRLGLIHPLVITRTGELIAGERRYTAVRQLGWTSVPIQYVDELEPEVLEAIELEENIKRQDITWQDQVRAIRRYHERRRSKEPGWRQVDTADAIGISRQRTNDMLAVAEELHLGNKMVAEAPKLSVAEGIVRRAQERRDATIIDKLHETFQSPALHNEVLVENILNVDFTEWVLGLHPIKYNFIHCDFPYGIDSNTFNQGGVAAHGGYGDTPETWERLMFALEIAMRECVAVSAHLMFWFAMRKADERLYEPTARRLESLGWNVNPQPLIWMKTDGAGILPDPERGPRQVYETCLFGARGDRKIVRAVSNAYGAPTVHERHMSEKPEPMLRHFFGMLVDQNTVMLDPTCGSGSALRAAESLGARHVLGLEVNGDFAALAKRALKEFRAKKAAANAV